MYIDVVPYRGSPPAVLLRRVLKGDEPVPADEAFRIVRARARSRLASWSRPRSWPIANSRTESSCCGTSRRFPSTAGPRGSKKSVRPLLFGHLTTAEGLQVAVDVFPGNTGDSSTVGSALDRLQERFGMKRVVLVGGRGMVTHARVREELGPRDADWITSLRAPTIRKLIADDDPLQARALELLDVSSRL